MFFEDTTKGAVAGAAVAANAAMVDEAVRCLPLPASRMPPHAVPLGEEKFAAVSEDAEAEPDFTVFLTRPCLSVNEVNMSPCVSCYLSRTRSSLK